MFGHIAYFKAAILSKSLIITLGFGPVANLSLLSIFFYKEGRLKWRIIRVAKLRSHLKSLPTKCGSWMRFVAVDSPVALKGQYFESFEVSYSQ